MIIAIIIVAAMVGYYWWYMRLPKFGKLPTGARLLYIQRQPNYDEGSFQNEHDTPQLAEGVTMMGAMKNFMFNKPKRGRPAMQLPSQKTDLHHLPAHKNVLVWFGHSSYFLQVDGKKFLVDPVFSGSASPLRFTTKSFAGSDVYTVADMPAIDVLIITHDHYDHMDYRTLAQLRPKVGRVITSLGVGAHLEHWGYAANSITEKNWNETVDLGGGFTIHTAPARHFSGRTFRRNQSLWQSFVLISPTKRLYLGGDSGYDTHFADIGAQYGPFDVAILECGQYHEHWRYIHMLPHEVVQAAADLKAQWLLPVHWGKFALSLHDWDTPINAVTQLADEGGQPIVTPMIGQELNLDALQPMPRWWDGIA